MLSYSVLRNIKLHEVWPFSCKWKWYQDKPRIEPCKQVLKIIENKMLEIKSSVNSIRNS